MLDDFSFVGEPTEGLENSAIPSSFGPLPAYQDKVSPAAFSDSTQSKESDSLYWDFVFLVSFSFVLFMFCFYFFFYKFNLNTVYLKIACKLELIFSQKLPGAVFLKG